MFFETGYLCIAMAVLGTHSVDQAALELRDLLSFLSAGIKGVYNHHPTREWAVFSEQHTHSLPICPCEVSGHAGM